MNNPLKLFMSYRSTDSAKVDTIVSRLASIREKGKETEPIYDPWQDKYGILGGQDWWQAIVNAIIACDVFVFHLSREALKSDVCKAELRYAQERNRFIIPVVLEGEYSYNRVTGKNDISYWDDLPTELKESRVQFIFYQGSSFYGDFEKAIAEYKRNPGAWKDIESPRPSDPRKATDEVMDSNMLYAQACDYADHLEFDTARKLFQKLINGNDPDFTSNAYEWIDLLIKYKKMMDMDAHAATRNKMPQLWDEYKKLFPKDFLEGLYENDIFDPKDFANRNFKQPPPSKPQSEPAPVATPPTPTATPVQSVQAAAPSRESFNAVVDLLRSHMGDANSRKSMVESALYGCRVLEMIDWSGAGQVFTVNLVRTLINFGQCEPGRPAIVMLLEELKRNVGMDRYPQIDQLIATYSAPK